MIDPTITTTSCIVNSGFGHKHAIPTHGGARFLHCGLRGASDTDIHPEPLSMCKPQDMVLAWKLSGAEAGEGKGFSEEK